MFAIYLDRLMRRIMDFCCTAALYQKNDTTICAIPHKAMAREHRDDWHRCWDDRRIWLRTVAPAC